MLSNSFRPWGKLKWLLDKTLEPNWNLITCLSTEERFIGTFNLLSFENKLNGAQFIKINDPAEFTPKETVKKLSENEGIIRHSNKIKTSIYEIDLLAQNSEIINLIKTIKANSSENVVIDISTFPKRFFFPIIKHFLLDGNFKNLIISYVTPQKYSQEKLSEEPEPWDHLPFFMPVKYPEDSPELAIISVGFMPFGLPNLLKDNYSNIPVKLLFPFPPGSPNYQRTWEFIMKIEKSYKLKPSDSIERINAIDITDSYNHILNLTQNGQKGVIFAPYGPKPISAAICIYASLTNSPVYYTQPKYYNPGYSYGIDTVLGYYIVLNKKNLYNF